MTKCLFDNENSFFAYINRMVDEINEILAGSGGTGGSNMEGIIISGNTILLDYSKLTSSFLNIENSNGLSIFAFESNNDTTFNYLGTNLKIDLTNAKGVCEIVGYAPTMIVEGLDPQHIVKNHYILGKKGEYEGIIPKGTKTITENKLGINVKDYEFVDVSVSDQEPPVVFTTTLEVQPKTHDQTHTPPAGYYYNEVKVAKVTHEIDPDIDENNITDDANILGVQGNVPRPTGNIEITANTESNQTIDIARFATATVRVPQQGEILRDEYYSGTINKLPFNVKPKYGFKLIDVTITGVDEGVGNLKPENIRYGKTVLGIPGSFVGSTDVVADGTELNPTKVYGTVNFAFGREYDSVKYILGLLNLAEGEMYYAICDSTMEHYVRIQKTSSDDYQIVIKDGETVIPVFGTNVDGDYKGFFINKYLFTSSFVSSSNVDGTTVGDKNYYLKNIISSTPFVSTKELEVPAPIYPSIRRQEIYSSSTDKVFDHIVVEPVTATIDPNIKKQYIAKDITIIGVQGELEAITGITNDSSVITVDYEYAPGNEMVFTNALKTMVIFENTCRDLTIYYDGEDGTFDFSGATGTITLKGDSSNTDVNFVFDGIEVGGTIDNGVTVNGTSVTVDNRYDEYNLNFDTNATYNISSISGEFNLGLSGSTINLPQARGVITIVCDSNNTLTLDYGDGNGLKDIKLNGTSVLQ